MINNKSGLTALAAGLLLSLAQPTLVAAQTPPPAQDEGPKVLLEDATRKILKAFELFMMTIPQYELPEVMPNGDIVIRRKNSGKGDGQPKTKPAPNNGAKT